MKELFAETTQEMLKSEMNTHQGCEKHEVGRKETANNRNGKGRKILTCEYDEREISVPRGRQSGFKPLVLRGRQSNFTEIEDQIMVLYAKIVRTQDIQDHPANLYGNDVLPTPISNVTIRIVHLING